MKKIKIAQIGTNAYSHGPDIFNSLKNQSEIFDIVGYVLPENEKERLPKRLSCFEGYKELSLEEVLNNPQIEAVTIETDEIYLTKYALMAAKAKKHIHMEKPGGRDIKDFEELIEIVKENKTVFHIGYMYRYNPYIIDLFNQIKNGELGEIISVDAQMSCKHPVEARKWLSTFKGGMMFYLGCHLVDLVLQIMGKPQRVISLNKSTGLDGISSEDFGMAVLEYTNGVSTVKTSASELGGFARRQLVVTGSKKTVEISPLEAFANYTDFNQALLVKRKEYSSADWGDNGISSTSEAYDRYDAMMASFAAMVRGEKQNPYTSDYELELYKTILKCCGVD